MKLITKKTIKDGITYYSIDAKKPYVKEIELMQVLFDHARDLLQLEMDNNHLFNNISSESLPSA